MILEIITPEKEVLTERLIQ